MTSVLVVDDDEALRSALVHELRTSGYEVSEANDVEAAIALLRLHAPDVLLTDLRMEGRDGIDLLAELRNVAPATIPVLMSGFATARDYQTATDLGAVKVLTKPFTPSEVIGAIQHALDCGTGFRGSVHGLSLIDLLQMFHFARRTIALHIEGTADAVIEFAEGEIVHAQVGELDGVAALSRTLAVPSGAMRTSVPATRSPRTINLPFQSLIMDVLRDVDESTRTSATVDLGASEIDDAFGTWSSLPPTGREQGADPRLAELVAILEKVAPQLAVAIVSKGSVAAFSVRNFAHSHELCLAAYGLCEEAERVTQQKCEQFEHVGDRVAFAVLLAPTADYAVVVDAPMLDRLSPQRFRSQVRQVASFLHIGETWEMKEDSHGKDR